MKLLSSLLTSLEKQTARQYRFRGGIQLPGNKKGLETPIKTLSLPDELKLPLLDYSHRPLQALVKPGDAVSRGQWLAKGLASPATGTISDIQHAPIIHPGGLNANCIVIRTRSDAEPEAQAEQEKKTGVAANSKLTAGTQTVTPNIASIKGLGGAAFPLLDKINALGNRELTTLIINAAECEPQIACDEALMQSHAIEIVFGINHLVALTAAKRCIVAIEDSKPLAIEKMLQAIEASNLTKDADTNTSLVKIELKTIGTRYPTGAELPLIKVTTNLDITRNMHPTDHGILCVNVATAHAVGLIYKQQFADSRVITIAGNNAAKPCNVRVRFGTSIEHILAQTENLAAIDQSTIHCGGPLSGFEVSQIDLPVTAQTHCILINQRQKPATPVACIRCSACADSCPAELLPQQLHWYAQANDIERCTELNLAHCIECGCCDLVCPSAIPLTATFRYAKSQQLALTKQAQQAAQAEVRFESREKRLAKQEEARAQRLLKRKEAVASNKSAKQNTDGIQSALARAREQAHNRAQARRNSKKDL